MALMFGKGMDFKSREGVFAGFLSKYVEETALASVIEPSQNDIVEINSVFTQSNGVGGNDVIDPVTMQDNSLLAYSSVLEDIGSGFTGEGGHEIASYTVQDGDTISFIASDFGVSINTIVWANNLKSVDQIKPGMELKIPPVTGVIHKIASGDTVAGIAKKYGVEADAIISFNNLPPDEDLRIDEEVVVPDGKIQTPVAPKTAAPSTVRRFANLPNLGGYFSLPVAGGRNWGRIHGRNGVDVANSCGTPIYAAAEGTVNMAKASGYNGGFGKFIRITHPNGTETLYAHASQVLVGVGQRVSRGTQIALMGTTGRSTGCHLHFEVHGAKNPLAR